MASIKTLGKVDKLVASVDATKIGTAVDDLSATAANAKKIVADVEASNIKKTLDDISKIGSRCQRCGGCN